MFSCLKGAEDSDALIMRVFNPGSEATAARVLGPVTIERVRLDESGRSPVTNGVVEVGPGEIATVRLQTIPG